MAHVHNAYKQYTALKLFRLTVAFGFAVNMVFVLFALLAPRLLEQLGAFDVTNTLHWLQDAGILLLIVTLAYIPVIRDPFRYLFITLLVVAGRFAAGSLFLIGILFMNYPDGLKLLATADLSLASLQAVLVYFVLRQGDPRAA